ncbi:MAG: leucyl aminopeptidase, partial [Rhodospirillaceae bacterium]|nr:leucyl aminopeptidase [Rhodospirillaceae bacterium]
RLVLADALWYTKERFKPQLMVDLATLTGAIVVSLAGEYAGIFSNDDKLAHDLEEAGKAMNEKLWRLPMGDAYDKMIDSPAADMQNISSGRGGGSITAAQFLKRFVGNTKWAHLDIAGVTWEKKGTPTTPKGGSGYGVRLLDRFVADRFEK